MILRLSVAEMAYVKKLFQSKKTQERWQSSYWKVIQKCLHKHTGNDDLPESDPCGLMLQVVSSWLILVVDPKKVG